MSFISRSLNCARKCTRSFATATPVANGSEEAKPLFGTVPSHRSYIFLRASEPPASFPARVSTPVQRALQLKASKWGGVVNFSWFEPGPTYPAAKGRDSATAFSTLGGQLEIPNISLENLDEVEENLRKHAEGSLVGETSEEIHLYVCTHGARDCRCGTIGSEVVKTLREEVARRVKLDPWGLISRVRVGEVGHVGGHQYAANLLVYPHGDWLGQIKPDDVSAILSNILDTAPRPSRLERAPLSPRFWRGRMGLSKDEQLQLFVSHKSTSAVLTSC